jgi:glycosyltransferase involved in cell wall biosynthesis
MRVLHVCGMYLPATEWGGPPFAVAGYADAERRAGIDCEVFATTARGAPGLPPIAPGARDVDGIRVTYFPAADGKQSLIAPAMLPALARRVREVDLVHTHMLWAFPGIVADWAAIVGRVPYVVTPHGSLDPWALSQRRWTKRAFLAVTERHTLRRAAFVHYTAEAERAQVPGWLRDAPSEIVPNVIDASRFAPSDAAVRRASREVLILGRIHLMKGFDVLIPAWREVFAAAPDARLVIAGPDEGGYRAEVERLIVEAGVGGSVEFTGHLDAAGRAERFARAALLVQPSFRENFGMAVAEAMAAELPVIVSDRVNIADDITAAGAGLVVPREPAALARAIAALLGDSERRLAMGRAGRRLVTERYAPAAVGAAMRAAYERALTRRA